MKVNDEAIDELWRRWQMAIDANCYVRAQELREMYLGLLALKQQEAV